MDEIIIRSRSPIGSRQDSFNVVFGPGDCVCTDFSDPKRLSGVNLPSGLYQTLSEWLADNSDSYLDSEPDSDAGSDASYYSYSTSSSRSRSRSPRRPRSRSRADSHSRAGSRNRGGSPESPVIIRRRSRSADEPRANTAAESDYYERPAARPSQEADARPIARGARRRSLVRRKTKPEPSKITWLAFGSRLGEFAVVYYDKGQYYLDGNVFDRFSTLQKWIIGKGLTGISGGHIPITGSDGSSLRLFFGPDNTYFAYDGTARDYISNIETREFQDWLSKITEPATGTNDTPKIKAGYSPHSLALGPNDMFCWICAEDFKVNIAFRQTFPSIEQYLSYTKSKGLLYKVTFTTSTYLQPGSKQPYYVLSTSDGICVSSVPSDASDLVSKSATRWGAIRAARSEKQSKRSERDLNNTRRKLASAVWRVTEAQQLIAGGTSKGRSRYRSSQTSQLRTIVTDLKRIDEDCNRNALRNERWPKASLADRVHMLIESRNTPSINGTNQPDQSDQPKEPTQSADDILWTIIMREIGLAHKLVDAGAPAEPEYEEGSTPIGDEIKHVVKQLTLINEEVDKETVQQGFCPNMNVAGRVAWLNSNLQSTVKEYTNVVRDRNNVFPLIKDAGTLMSPAIAQPDEPSMVTPMKAIVQDLKRIKVAADGFRNDSDDWFSETLANKVDYMLKDLGYFKEDYKSLRVWQDDLAKSLEQKMSKEGKGDIKKDRVLQLLKDMVSEYKRRPYPPGRDLTDPYV